jgi:iron-sulfur cluster assembly enzyme ISCU, mitochondrial
VLAEDAIRSAIRDYRKKVAARDTSKAEGFIDVTQSVATGETVATARPNYA